ncbi:MAG TPA: hypothetical protein VFG39_08005 [Balneolaceae bacterium]|nr:hypothetical protein [Balneolaceae bacterium]
MNKIIINLSIVSALFLLFGCSSPTKIINSDVDIIGIITEIKSGSERLGILVEEDSTVTRPEKKIPQKIWLYVSKETEIYKQGESKSLIKINSEDLKIGLKVKGWAGQAVLMSYPAHADAVQIIAIDNY